MTKDMRSHDPEAGRAEFAAFAAGFTSGAPDFGWSATGPLNWNAKSSFNPYMDPEIRLKILVNGIADKSVIADRAKELNLPRNWESHRVDN